MTAAGYGVFRRGRLQLALPLHALREVVPCSRLDALPCAAPCVVGGLDLRGTLLPVIDLQMLIGAGAMASPTADNVVVMVSEGRLLGVLADSVTGIFGCEDAKLSRLAQATGGPSLICGGFPRDDDGSLVSLLSVEALASLPGVPQVADPRRSAGVDETLQDLVEEDAHLMLLRSGDLSFALKSTHVHTTLLDPVRESSALSGGYCLGAIEHAGRRVPAVDLAAFCGFDALPAHTLRQAFVLNFDGAYVAMLVEEVVDVVRTVIPPAAGSVLGALPEGEVMAGVLSLDALPAHSVRAVTRRKGFYLRLDETRLMQSPALIGLSKLNTPVEGAGGDASEGARDRIRPGHRVITYDIGVEVATPIDQISEILPWRPDEALGGTGGSRAALVVSRGRSIPTWCLSSMFGRVAPPLSPSASVLVVEHDGGLVGFSVSRLMTIDEALPPRGEGRTGVAGAVHSFDHRMVGSGDEARMISLMDLQRVAGSLKAA